MYIWRFLANNSVRGEIDMINDAEMLTYILQNAEMGCQGVKNVREGKPNTAMDSLLCSQLERYGKIYQTAGEMLKKRGEELHRVSPMAKTMAKLSTKRDLKRDPSMGVNKMAQHLRDYDRTDPNITLLAKKMLDVEQSHISELRAFL